jgi:hypothetical protein
VTISGLELASWWGRRTYTHAAGSRAELRGLIALCRDVVVCLERVELLAPSSIQLSEWVLPGGEAADRPVAEVRGGVHDLEARILAEVDRDPRRAVPTELVIGGATRIIESSGVDWAIDDVITVTATQGDMHLVSIAVFGDAFMTHDLFGAPQLERHLRNAPRLQQALAEIERAVSPLTPISTKRAEARGLELRNLTTNGQVFPLDPSVIRRDGETSSLFLTDQIVIGARLLAGSGDQVRAGFLARSPETSLLITLTQRHDASIERLRDELALQIEGVAPLVWIGDGPADGIPYEDVLVEELPPGARRVSVPLNAEGAIALGVACAEILTRAGEWIGGLCPETIYVDGDGRFAALAARGPRFIGSAPQYMRGMRSYALPYLGFEVLALSRPPTPASDVFALCATLHTLVTGTHPFGKDLGEIMKRLLGVVPDRLPGPLGEVIARGLDNDPARRPSAAQLVAQLRSCAGGS